MVKSNNRKFSIVSLALFVVVLLFASCGKGDGKSSGKDSTPEYIYESKFNDLGTVGVDYVSQSFIKDGDIYMTGSHYKEDKKKGTGTSVNYIMTGSFDDKKVDMAEIKGLKENESTDKLFMDEDGNIIMLSSVYSYNEKTNVSNTKYFILKLDKNGKVSVRTELKPDVKKNEEFYLGSSIIYINNKLIAVAEQKVYIFNKDGSLDKTVEADNYIDSIFPADNGKVYVFGSVIKSGGMADRNKDGKIQFVILEGEPGHQDAIIRTENAVETLKKQGIVLEKLCCSIANWNRAQAQNRMMQIIGQYQNKIELVLANNDDMALGAVDAYKKLNYTESALPVFFGIDGTDVGLNAVKDLELAGTVYNDKEGQAAAIAKLAVEIISKKEITNKYTYLPYSKVTSDNVNDFLNKDK